MSDEKNTDNNNTQPTSEELFVAGIETLILSQIKHIVIAVTDDGQLACYTSDELARHEVVGMLEALRDETKK
jgi:hypothetical protein